MRSSIFISSAFALVASARLIERQGVDCQAAYSSCLGFGRPEVACQCELATCTGEDNARTREYCATATANLGTASSTTQASTASASASASSTPYVSPCQAIYNTCIASGRAEVACQCDLATCTGEDNARTREYCASATASLASSTTTASNGPSSAPNTPVPGADGSINLGQPCSETKQCAGSAECFASNSMLVKQCGNFNAQCKSDSQCAYNTCNNGLCNGFLNSSAYPANTATVTGSASILPIPTTTSISNAPPSLTAEGMPASTTPAGTKTTAVAGTTTSPVVQFTGAASKEQVGAGVALVAALFAAAL